MKEAIYYLFLKVSVIFLLFFMSCAMNPFVGIGNDQDVQFPVVLVTSHDNTDYVGRNFKLKGKSSDDKGVDYIIVSADGIKDIKIKTSNKWETNIDASSLKNGSNKFTITVYDKSGKSRSTYLNLNVDKDGPLINLSSPVIPAMGDLTLQGRVTFTGIASDTAGVNPVSDHNRIRIYKRDDPNDIVFSRSLSITSGVWSVSGFDSMDAAIEAGEYTLQIKFADILGNVGVFVRDVQVLKEIDEPEVTIISPDPASNPPLQVSRYLAISGFATDNRKITAVYYNIKKSDNTYVFSDFVKITPENQLAIVNFSELIDIQELGLTTGEYWVDVYGEDDNSPPKISSNTLSKFVIDTDVPDIRILDSSTTPTGVTPLESSYINGTFDVEITTSTPDPKTVQYRIKQDGVIKKDWTVMSTIDTTNYTATIDTSHTDFIDNSATVDFKITKGTKFGEVNRLFYFDNDPPDIDVISHSNNQDVNGGIILSGSSSDNMGLEKVEVFDSNPIIDDWVTASGTTIWEYAVSTDANPIEDIFSVGKHEEVSKIFQIRATDRAGNTFIYDHTFNIKPITDYPTFNLLMPENDGEKVSGMMSILCVMNDDDFPVKPMTANISIYNESAVEVINRDYTTADPGFPNLSMAVDTATLTDMHTYTVRINGEDWNGREADEEIFTFQVDKNVPMIELTNPTDDVFKTTSINFSGTIKDKNNITGGTLSFKNADGDTVSGQLTLTPGIPDGDNNTWSFDCTLNNSGNETGFSDTNLINWTDDSVWGNSPRLFTIRADDETGLTGYLYVMVNLDNTRPTVEITSPGDGHIIGDDDEVTTLEIKGTVDDTPPNGVAYPIEMKDVEIKLFKNGVYNTTIKAFDNGDESASNFTYEWNTISEIDDGNDYTIRVYVRDNAGNVPSPVIYDEIAIVKNTNPPKITDITYESKSYYSDMLPITVKAVDRGEVDGGNGVKKLEFLVDGVVQAGYTQNYVEPWELEKEHVFNINTSELTNGIRVISFRVTDRDDTVYEKSAGNFPIDNQLPVISPPTYQTNGYTGNITEYSTFLGITVEVNDTYSLAGDNPEFKLGTSLGGSDIRDWTYFNSMSWNGEQSYTAVFDNYINLFEYPGPVYLTVKATDAAGNEQESTFTISKSSSLPNLTIDYSEGEWISDRNDTTIGDGNINITGNVDAASDNLWIRIDGGGEVEIPKTGNWNDGTYEYDYTLASLTEGAHTLRLRTSKSGIQNILTRTINVDKTPPVVTINSVIAKADEGYVSGTDVSGKVIISGTYNDNYADKLDELTGIDDAELRLTIDEEAPIDLNASGTVIRGFSGSDWTWSYEWDTESISDVVKNGVQIEVSAKDIADNIDDDSVTRNVVPYITRLTSSDPDKPVQDVNWYENSSWDNHDNRRYSLLQGTAVEINGYNLKNIGNPTVTLGANTLTVTASTMNKVTATIPSNDTNGKSDNITLTVNSIASTPVYVYVFRIDLLGDDTVKDTYNAKGYDMSLYNDAGTMRGFVTFTRDHQVEPYYSKIPEGNFSADDYSTYRIRERASYNTAAANAYNNFGVVDPMFFTANVVYGTSTYMVSCLDEWTGGEYEISTKTDLTDTTNWHAMIDNNSNGIYRENPGDVGDILTSTNNYNTIKYGSSVLRNQGGGNGHIYLAQYNDDSRSMNPEQALYLWTITLNNYNQTNGAYGLVDNQLNPGPWNSVALRTSGANVPVIMYYTQGDDKLNIAYNTGSYTPWDNSFTKRKYPATGTGFGGRYNSVAIAPNNLIITSYQTTDKSLEIGTLSAETDTNLSRMVIESVDDQGITGFNTSIALSDDNRPYISYLNNANLNSNGALRLARYNSTTITEAAITNTANWEYIIVPSPVSVNDGKTVTKWDSNSDIPVTLFKGNNYLYVARLIE